MSKSSSCILFAKDIPGANIEKCQEAACKHPQYAYYFARNIPDANVEKCQKAAFKNPEWAYWFTKLIFWADVEKYREVSKGSKYGF